MENSSTKTSGKWLNWLKSPAVVAILIVLIFLVSQVLTLSDYGMAWDESLGNAFFGERNLFFYRTFDQNYLDFKYNPPNLANLPLNLFASTWKDQPNVFPPFGDLIAAGTLHLFSYQLNWLSPIDGLHFAGVLFSSVLLFSLYIFLHKRFGMIAAIIGTIALATLPRFWGDTHFNIKDIPEAALFSLAIFSYMRWYEKPHWWKAVLFGVLFGLTTLTKINSVFIPIIVILGLWGSNIQKFKGAQFLPQLKTFLLHHLLMVIAAFHTIILGWPIIFRNFNGFIEYVTRFMGQGQRSGPTHFQWETIQLTFATMPEYFAVLLIAGLAFAGYRFIKDRNVVYRLLIVWCLIPIIRISLPGMSNFDGIRHYLEFLPAAAALVGIGFYEIVKWLRKYPKPVAIAVPGLLILIMVLNLTDAYLSYRPYEYLYFNRVSGGTTGAIKTFGKDAVSDYWAVSYRKGLEWIKANAEVDSALYTPIGGHIVDITSRFSLRPDIEIVEDEEAALKTSRPLYVMFINRPAFFKSFEKNLVATNKPVFTIQTEGHVILYIFKY